MRRQILFFALAGVLFGSACRQDEPATTVPTPTSTASPSPSPSPLQDFVLEGEVQEIWTVASVTFDEDGPSPSPGASPAPSPQAGSTASPTGGASPGASPAAVDNSASGAVAVKLTSYFSESGCAFKPGDLVVIRITPRTTLEPSELADDEDFPENLENVRVTIAGVLLEPGAHCLPVAESITRLEGAAATASPRPTASPNRARPRARTARRTPSPTPARTESPAPAAQPGATTGPPSTGSDREEDEEVEIDPPSGTDEDPPNGDPPNGEDPSNGEDPPNGGGAPGSDAGNN